MLEAWVRSVGWEDPLVKGMATHSSMLAWRIPWTEEPGGQVCGVAEWITTERFNTSHFPFIISCVTHA